MILRTAYCLVASALYSTAGALAVGTGNIGISNVHLPIITASEFNYVSDLSASSNYAEVLIHRSNQQLIATSLLTGSGSWSAISNATIDGTIATPTGFGAKVQYTLNKWSATQGKTWDLLLPTNSPSEGLNQAFISPLLSTDFEHLVNSISNLFTANPSYTNVYTSGTTRSTNILGGWEQWTGVAYSAPGAMITERHYMVAAHNSSFSKGTTITFYATNGLSWTPYVTNSFTFTNPPPWDAGQTTQDLLVHELNESAPAWVKIYKICPASALESIFDFPFGRPLIGHFSKTLVITSQGDYAALSYSLPSFCTTNRSVNFGSISGNAWAIPFTRAAASGESSSPVFAWNGEEPLILFCCFKSTCGPVAWVSGQYAGPPIYPAQVVAQMNAKFSPYSVTVGDLSP